MKNKVKIVDYYGIKSFHEIFNTSLAIMCAQIFDEVYYIAGKSSCKNVEKCFETQYNRANSSIHFISRFIYEKDTSFGAFIRTVWGMFVTLKEYLFIERNTVLVFNYTNPLSMPIILLINYFFKKKVVFVMHGELELLLKRNLPIYKISFLYRICHRVSFKYFFKKNKAILLVLGDSIKANLCKMFVDMSANVYSICHPYFVNNNVTIKKHKILTIGTIGVMKKEKGLDNLIKLSEELNDEICKNRLIIKSIGQVIRADVSQYKNIKWIGNKTMLPRSEFDKEIQSLDYILYLYPTDSYKFTASGAIMDAIKLEKPIIAFHNDYFDYLLKDACIGYLVNNLSDMIAIIKKLIETADNKDFKIDFEYIRKKIGIDENCNILKNIFIDLEYVI